MVVGVHGGDFLMFTPMQNIIKFQVFSSLQIQSPSSLNTCVFDFSNLCRWPKKNSLVKSGQFPLGEEWAF